MNTDYFKKLSELPDFRLRVSACNSGLPFEVAFDAPADFIRAWMGLNEAGAALQAQPSAPGP
jgi:hypothetical protein